MHKLISALIVYHHNIKILHWTCKGNGFDATHEYLDDLTKQLYEYTDVIAEIMVSKDKIVPTLTSAISILDEDDKHEHLIISGEYHDCKECSEATFRMLSTLYELYNDAHEGMESDIVSILDEHMSWIRKECFYKMKLRLK